jgi:glyoxylase-like metal-dependent hydrolase (beta-lactamase superfamily II)
MSEPVLFEEAPGVTRVDLRWTGLPAQIAAYLVDGGDGFAVVETGPASTLPTLLAAVRAVGREPGEITHVLVTHVHLDHAGGAGALLEHAPRASVHVHPVGAPHLAHPGRLIASAERLYGDRMGELWGRTVPVPADRLVKLHDGDEVRVGRRRLRAVETPGHAWHHHAFHDPDAGLVVAGDAAGIRLLGVRHVRPPTPPPEIDVPRWLESVERLRALRPARLLLTHFGGVEDVAWHLDDLAERLRVWERWAETVAGAAPADAADALRRLAAGEVLAATGDAGLAELYEATCPSELLAAGLLRWIQVRDRAAS